MAEKIELIDAKDLPVTEEEDVTVLCVGADGEMVRRDAGSFGGGGYILKPTADEITLQEDRVVISSDCTDMVKALEAGANVMVLIPENIIAAGEPAVLFSVNHWQKSSEMLAGWFADAGFFAFPNAPIPSFLQG